MTFKKIKILIYIKNILNNKMDGTTLDLSNRGLKDINEVQQMLSSYSSGIEMLNLSGNYLKYVSLYI